MRIPVVIFIIGIIIMIGGVVLAIAIPATVTWKPESEILASESLAVSAGWNSESDSLIDEVITVDLFETYDYGYGWPPLIFEEATGFVIAGNATEQSSPQSLFNFYVFDSVNFDLWRDGVAYTAYYEAEGKASVSFSFSIATEDEVPDTFYFVVEEYILTGNPIVRVTSTIGWVEQASIYDRSNYIASTPTIVLLAERKDFRLKGNATEETGKKFNFYIMDWSNYFSWEMGDPYTAHFEQKDVSSTTFDIPLTEDQSIYFVVENPLIDINEAVETNAVLEWQEKATTAATISGIFLGGIVASIGLIITIAGVVALVFKPEKKSMKVQ